MLKDVVESYNMYLERIPNGVKLIADNLRKDQVETALLEIKNFSEGIIWLSDASRLITNNGVNVDLPIDKIQQFLVEINEGLEKRDYVLVADIFEYEIADFFINVAKVNDK